MGNPRTVMTFDPGLETFAAQFFDERGRKKRGDDGQPFIRSKGIDSFANFRKWFDASGENRANIQCFEFTCHVDYSSHWFRRRPPNAIRITDQIVAIVANQSPAWVIHQFAN